MTRATLADIKAGCNPFSKIIGTGNYLPSNYKSNTTLAVELFNQYGVETSDEWIVGRTGIQGRHLADSSENTSDLALRAAEQALTMAQIDRQTIDLIIVATTTPDFVFPSTACLLQQKLGITNHCAAFDVQAVCSGFIYALATADALIKTGMYRRALVVGAEVFSRLIDYRDRNTCVLFGDGAGAVLLEASQQAGILKHVLRADGRHSDKLCVSATLKNGQWVNHPFVYMNGPEVYKLAVAALAEVALDVLQKAGLKSDQIDWFIPHQANFRIMSSTCKKLGLPLEKMVSTVSSHANTSAASVPLALDKAVRDGRIQRGHLILLEGVGGGFTWGASLLRY